MQSMDWAADRGLLVRLGYKANAGAAPVDRLKCHALHELFSLLWKGGRCIATPSLCPPELKQYASGALWRPLPKPSAHLGGIDAVRR